MSKTADRSTLDCSGTHETCLVGDSATHFRGGVLLAHANAQVREVEVGDVCRTRSPSKWCGRVRGEVVCGALYLALVGPAVCDVNTSTESVNVRSSSG